MVKYEACPRCRERGKDSRGDNMAIYRDGSKHCFACALHVSPPLGSRWANPGWKEDHKSDSVRKGILPGDYITEIPQHAWKWLLQYGLPVEHWNGLVGYSEIRERLIIRIGDPLAFSLGRYTPKGQSDSAVRKWHVFGDCHNYACPVGDGDIVVLVEDIISAHKIGQVGLGLPLFGTTIFPAHINYIKQQGKPVVLWLDKDQEGTLHKKASNIEALTGLPCDIITTIKDPKELSFAQISNHLAGKHF